ncbi:hypothetical protein MIND_01265200 [Mycena indigotica]|uniref:Succinate dehydrogenase assembly factor 3 n=1 Tax=Mycena indigotica TaxID=2126181 RepID=A0A8H6S2G3_9AGAR|nr:uncharacterized protein MIND_01265200 [Mycena indigotica]KAF7291217.1 hypothetical protein MIND_01265200 [Mycena indigotica]
MRAARRCLAEASRQTLNAQHVAAALLPPKPLLRALLRAHRGLAADLRYMGDRYVKDEFRRHRETTNPVHVMGFLAQWKMYLDALPRGPGAQEWRGRKLDATAFEKMSTEQLGQLHELMHAAKGVWRDVPPGEDRA